ncbi:MAG: GAF domain-containing protein [Anaerolineae bacterium]|nr:GAF domain-containing protein [Anaerolineae bacterium]
MIALLRYLFIVQYDYRDSAQATRARLLLPLIGMTAVLAAIFSIFLIVVSVTGIDVHDNVPVFGGVVALVMFGLTGAALWLTQRGHLQLAAALMALFLAASVVASLLTDGIAAVSVSTLPFFLIYAGLAYRTRGTMIAWLLTSILLPLTAYLQSEGQLPAEQGSLDELMSEALVTLGMLTVATLLLWIFAWNSQHTLARATRIATQTRTTAATGQEIARILNIHELLTHAVDLIRDRFAFYQVQIFMLDDSEAYANLAASTGEMGSILLAQGYRVPVSSRTVVGEAISGAEVRYVPDITATAYQHPEQLSETRTQLALPLNAGDELVGVLDIQSVRPDAFKQEDIEAMRIMANQVGQAIQNARLFESQQQGLLQNRRMFLESQTNFGEIERLNRQLTGESWQGYLLERGNKPLRIRLAGQEMAAEEVEMTTLMQQAIQRRRIVSQVDLGAQVLAVPISIRDQVIGAVEVRLPSLQNQSEVRSIIQAVVERMAFSLENARLFEQTQMAAERERRINQITTQLQGLTTVEDVLTTAISTLGQALGANYGSIRMAAREDMAGDGQGDPHT